MHQADTTDHPPGQEAGLRQMRRGMSSSIPCLQTPMPRILRRALREILPEIRRVIDEA